ncbi:hypothetical protein J2S40_001741 [Nocardioides luteus]|uniref:Uncharacterized protein n=1 Tax=Nocardioides luteus TaxID=1844 RepID=A0ABQ5T0D7_9ACTN|nr:hypothetical protein [Nocardioides luteus]MDR7310683.1 hypothetical protein [Nocardioides luteus]GGR41288.1 hypothetical protein GCM10010197_03120 [Nocardioides luteus]GLJ69536.1 hypothetical protein GCM10017579_35720 [Nocardioides luteus]
MSPAAPAVSRYADLSREELAEVVRELLLIGQLIDRSGMAWCISAFGREEMLQIAITEWAAASPIYTRRMQAALGYAPDVPGRGDVPTIFKGLQIDIGAPPQFMDFRYTVHDEHHGEFHLDHCGALMDVEPMGEEYVRGMCHDIEDPTFDATAIATHPRAQVRPVHRPPRVPADRTPHCRWTVTIDDAHPEAVAVPELAVNEQSRAARLELTSIDPADEGVSDYSGPLLSDLDLAAFSRSALVRIADEVCLQMALLDRGFVLALQQRATSPEQLLDIRRKQLVGVAGIAGARLARVLSFSPDTEGALRLLALHPMLNPAAYVSVEVAGDALIVRPAAADEDGAWVSLMGPAWSVPLRAAVRALDPHLDVDVSPLGHEDGWRVEVVRRPEPAPEASEVAVVRFSTGADFAFEPRRSLPITPV